MRAVLLLVCGILGVASAKLLPENGNCQQGLQPSNSSAAPTFVINLDLPPSERWKELSLAKKDEVYRIHVAFKDLIGGILGGRLLQLVDDAMPDLLETLPWPFNEEMKALSDITGLPLGEVVLYNVFYEFFTVCTSIVAEDESGNLFHARNLDFGLFLGWDSANHTWAMTEILRPTVVTLDFQRSGETVFKAAGFAGYLGVLTGVKKGSFSLTVNERFKLNGGYIGIIEWLLGDRSQHWVGFLTRQLMENETSYDAAKKTLSSTRLLAPVYFILGGKDSGQAAIITRDRDSDKADVLELSDTVDKWFLLQTNYDHWTAPPFYDDRRGPGTNCMRNMTRQNLSFNGLYNVLSTQPVLNLLTVYSALMRVSTGELETYLQVCEPPCTPW